MARQNKYVSVSTSPYECAFLTATGVAARCCTSLTASACFVPASGGPAKYVHHHRHPWRVGPERSANIMGVVAAVGLCHRGYGPSVITPASVSVSVFVCVCVYVSVIVYVCVRELTDKTEQQQFVYIGPVRIFIIHSASSSLQYHSTGRQRPE